MSKVSNLPVNRKNLEYVEVKFEVKQLEDQGDGFFRFEGMASTFGNIDLVDDIIERGAFKESLEEVVPVILWQHRSSEPIGMPEFLAENEEGLFVRAKLPKSDTLVSGRVIPQVEIGSIKSMSIGFRIPPGGAEVDSEGIRRINKAMLAEISLVTFPANPMAKVTGFKSVDDFTNLLDSLGIDDEGARKALTEALTAKTIENTDLKFLDSETIQTQRDFEKSLRDSGLFSKQAATTIASFYQQRDSAGNDEIDCSAVGQEIKSIMQDLDAKKLKSQVNDMLNDLRGQ